MKEKIAVIESVFEHKGLKCAVLFLQSGHRCGYVGVEESSPFFGVEYSPDLKNPALLNKIKESEFGKRGIISLFCWDGEKVSPEMLFNVHGGITYSSDNLYLVDTELPTWWFGFDCAHCDDGKDFELMQKYFPEDYQYLVQHNLTFSHGPVRTKEYCEQECRNLAEQITEYEMILKEE